MRNSVTSGAMLLCLAALWPHAVRAEGGQPLGLLDAVGIALKQNPSLQLSRTQVVVAEGGFLERQGDFDGLLTVNASLSYVQEEMTGREIQGQIDQRTQIEEALSRLTDRSASLNAQLAVVRQAQADPDNAVLPDPVAQAQLELVNSLIRNATDPDQRARFEQIRSDSLETEASALVESITAVDEQIVGETDRLLKLGAPPRVRLQHAANVGVTYRQVYHNGWTVSGFYNWNLEGSNFKGKQKPTEFGGLGLLDSYTSQLGVRLNIPFAKGRNDLYVGQRIAELQLDATRQRLSHQVSQTVFQTATAYWNLVAARVNRDVLRDSRERQRRLRELTQALIDADQLPQAEIARSLASEAQIAASLAQSEQSLIAAQLALARLLGSDPATPAEAPWPTDALPEPAVAPVLDGFDYERLAAVAQRRRLDYQASLTDLSGRELSATLADQNLARTHTLDAEASFNAVEEGSSIRRGLEGTVLGRLTGPSVSLTYTYERPTENLAARGSLMQESAILEQQRIQTRDAAREINLGLIEALTGARDAALEYQQLRTAVEKYVQSIGNERDQLELGNSTVIDLLLTEERLTSALTQAAAAQSRYARLAVQTRFLAGALVDPDDDELRLQREDLIEVRPADLLEPTGTP